MEHILNKNVKNIQISKIRKFFNLASTYSNVISLTIGEPDLLTPQVVKSAGIEAISADKTRYTHNAGLIELRKAACNYFSKYGLNYNPDNEVITTCGASEAIYIAFNTILDSDCEVIIPAPTYPAYESIVRLLGAAPVFIDTSSTSLKLTAEAIREKITSKTRCIVIPYPSNPTGVILDPSELNAIAEVVKDKDIFLLSDEIYSELVFDGTHSSIASIEAVRDKTIVINGLSKSHSMTGWRIGFTFAPEYITSQMIKVHQYINSCASSISQYAALEALASHIDMAPRIESYKTRRDYVYNRLVSMGLEVVKPEGAFYIFPSIKKFNLSSYDFAAKLLEIERVAVVPGDAFTVYGEGYIRISFAYSMESLEIALDRLEKFISTIKQYEP
jgi:aminotransferase